MYFVLFEGTVKESKGSIAAKWHDSLVPELHKIQGFLTEDFYGSPHLDSKSLNVTTWEDAAAVRRWRNEEQHLKAQRGGFDGVYQDIRLRLGHPFDPDVESNMSASARNFVVLYYRKNNDDTPSDDVTSLLDPNMSTKIDATIADSAVFKGSRTVWVASFRHRDEAQQLVKSIPRTEGDEIQQVCIERDYDKTNRKDAPHQTPGAI